jgi:hypothetical protein
MNTMTPMELDAYAQGQTAARCGWGEDSNEFTDEIRRDAWDAGFHEWLGVPQRVADARALCDTAELFAGCDPYRPEIALPS